MRPSPDPLKKRPLWSSLCAFALRRPDELALLLAFPNVLITAHQASLARETLSDIARTPVANPRALALAQPFVKGPVLT